MQRSGLEYPTDYPLFSGMEEHGPQDEYAEFLVQAIHDVEVLVQIQQRLESLVKEVKALQGQ